MERIGIYGGTFNPPHLGHFQGAEFARQALKLDRLLMMPDREPPHKELPHGTPDDRHRLAMVEAGAGSGAIEASGMSLAHPGPSYTFQSLERVRQMYPQAELFFLMGSDMFCGFLNWREPERILKEASLCVLCRGEKGESQRIAEVLPAVEKMGGRVILLENPVVDISSTQLRRLLVFRAADPFLPEPVAEYIRRNGLYGTGEDLRNLPLEQLREWVIRLLKPSRVAHVLGCRQAAVELARLYGADETDAARAALLHDVTKALDGPLQLTLCREYGTMLDDFSTKNPKTLHALTGSLVAERIFGENEAVVSAIRCHTTGKADMNLLQKILYVADYMEPNRDFPGVEELRRLAYTDITGALKLGLEMTLAMLRSQGREISPESREALAYLENNGA